MKIVPKIYEMTTDAGQVIELSAAEYSDLAAIFKPEPGPLWSTNPTAAAADSGVRLTNMRGFTGPTVPPIAEDVPPETIADPTSPEDPPA